MGDIMVVSLIHEHKFVGHQLCLGVTFPRAVLLAFFGWTRKSGVGIPGAIAINE